MMHVSLKSIGPNATGEQVNAVFIQPTLAYGRGPLHIQLPVSKYDAKLLP